jgi:hypothetical protein
MRRGEDGGFGPSQTGEDLEEMMKESRVITAEEEAKMKEGGVMVIEGVKRLIDEIVSRKKLKQVRLVFPLLSFQLRVRLT